MSIVLGIVVAAMCGYRAYTLYRAEPADTAAWAITGGWAAATISALALAII